MKNKIMPSLKGRFGFIFENFLPKFFSAWFLSGFIFLLVNHDKKIDKSITGSINTAVFVVIVLSLTMIISCIDLRLKEPVFVPGMLVCAFFAFSAVLLCKINSFFTYIAVAIIFVLCVRYLTGKDLVMKKDLPKQLSVAFAALAVMFFAHYTMTITVLRYENYSAPNYDFGIFMNMYYHMKTTLKPLVSCERDRMLSHFAVHISPVLYLLLPIYAVFPDPVTIAVMQVVVIYSGIIPVFLIARKYKLSYGMTSLISIVFAAYPALCANCMFDFHENCFMTPLILWMIYFYESGKNIPMFIFAALTLSVKEDAAVYVAVFGMYLIISEKKYSKGSVLTLTSIAYFLIACTVLKNYGDGVMTNRYNNLIEGDAGIFGIVKTVLVNPGYTLSEAFAAKDESYDKVLYFLQMFIPLAFVPFFTKKPAKLILVLPVLLNLLTDFPYQYQITFQYSFGISAFLLYLFIMNNAEAESPKRRFNVLASAGLSVLLFLMMFTPRYSGYITTHKSNGQLYREMDAILETIPEDKSITASAFIVTHLTNRDVIYEVEYHDAIDTDYLVLDMRPGYDAKSEGFAEKYTAAGYTLIGEVENGLAIYASPEIKK